MKCKFLLIYFVILNWPVIATANDLYATPKSTSDTLRIGNIIVYGNEKTKTHIILRELEFTSGSLITISKLEAASKRIENLDLFNRVEFQLSQNDNRFNLYIFVWERWYLFPSPIFQVNEHDWGKLSYGLGLYHANFRGTAEKLWFAGWLGYNPGLNFEYSNPWLGGRQRLYLNFSFLSQTVSSKSLLYPETDEFHRSVSVLFGKRFGIDWYSDITLAFSTVKSENQQILWNRKKSMDKIFSTGFSIQLDSRDLWEYPKKGTLSSLSFTRNYLIDAPSWYDLWQFSWREYRTLWGIICAGRLFGSITHNEIPVYRHQYLGYAERVRGHFSEVYEGGNLLLGSFEMRIPVLKEKYIKFPADSRWAGYLQNMKYGLYVTIFRDTGAVWKQNEKLSSRHWQSGLGFGLNFILPYSNILRLEYAFDEDFNSEYIIDANIAF